MFSRKFHRGIRHRDTIGWATLLPMALLAAAAIPDPANAQSPIVNWESGPVRPVALSPDGTTLFVTNIPDARLEIYDVTDTGLDHRTSVQVGLEPVAVGVRNADEIWVVNHLSDSVSIVDVAAARVKQTLLVGDEPRDIVFAAGRAFITTARRGQHRVHSSIADVPGAGDPRLTTPGVGRADVWVFDAANPGESLGGTPTRILELFGDAPRALAVSNDGNTIFAAIFHSGNRTTTVAEGAVCDGFEGAGSCVVDGATMPGGNPGPSTNVMGDPAPEVGLIVQLDPVSGQWRDEMGRDWSGAVRFHLPDYDVFAIDSSSLAVTREIAGVGTTLFNMAVNPVSGYVYVTNTESRNQVRFEGPGIFGGSTVQGDLARTQVTVLQPGATTPRHLNKHINYETLPAPAGTSEHSLAIPLGSVVSSDGTTLYVAAFGSRRIGVLPTSALENDSFDPQTLSSGYIATSGGGPAGLVLDNTRNRLYVYTRFDNAIAAIDLEDNAEIDKLYLPIGEPGLVRDGRRFLYDANATSSNGEASCASCHIFADMDHLAWDLGNPDDEVTKSPIPIKLSIAAPNTINGTGDARDFHPMKGPMTTQTLRGLQFSGAQHWRGDRSVGMFGTNAFDSLISFKNFIVAFPGLIGMNGMPTEAEMEAFAQFGLTLAQPPNPNRNLDNSLTAEQQQAFDFYTSTTRISDGVPIPGLGFSCNGCHVLDPAQGFFGTDGEQSFENETQILKVAQLRNLYQKVGMFGMPAVPFVNAGNNGNQGDQIRGFGFLHDGSIDTVFRFFSAGVFNAAGANGFQSDSERRAMEALMLAFDTDVAPVLGQQVTVWNGQDAAQSDRVDLLLTAATRPFTSKLLGGVVTECDVVAKEAGAERVRGYWFNGTTFVPDDDGATLSVADLLARATASTSITFTAVVPGHGRRFAIDRDLDGALDGVDPCPNDANATVCSDGRTPPGEICTGTDCGMTEDEDGGCGCNGGGGPDALACLMVALALGLRRRRPGRQSCAG